VLFADCLLSLLPGVLIVKMSTAAGTGTVMTTITRGMPLTGAQLLTEPSGQFPAAPYALQHFVTLQLISIAEGCCRGFFLICNCA